MEAAAFLFLRLDLEGLLENDVRHDELFWLMLFGCVLPFY
jgi:hypothetical protein